MPWMAKFKSDLTSLPHYGRRQPTVSGIYRLSQRHSVGFIGFNGTFNVRVALKTGASLTVTTARSRPARRYGRVLHACDLYVVSVVHRHHGRHRDRDSHQPGWLAGEVERTAHSLMLKIWDSVEHPVH